MWLVGFTEQILKRGDLDFGHPQVRKQWLVVRIVCLEKWHEFTLFTPTSEIEPLTLANSALFLSKRKIINNGQKELIEDLNFQLKRKN